MSRFLPRSLTGQLALVMAAALLMASLVNFVLLLGERQRAALIEQSGPPIARFVDVAENLFTALPAVDGSPVTLDRQRGPGRYALLDTNQIDEQGLARHDDLERRLNNALSEAGVKPDAVRAATRQLSFDGRARDSFGWQARHGRKQSDRGSQTDDAPRTDATFDNPSRPRGPLPEGRDGPRGPDGAMREAREILLAAQLPDGRWLTSMSLAPEATQGDVFLLAASTLIIFISVLAAALWVASRLSRPLKDLAAAAARVGDANEPQQVPVRGPGDVQQTIDAFNAMSLRVSQLLREKDVMLGALGHDLRTPLSSLRIRIESMEPEVERQKAVRTIEEASVLLEDILELARQGQSREPERPTDISVIVADIAEDYAETGAPVTLVSTQRAVAVCRTVLLRRALRNLIDNAVAYGGAARIGVETAPGEVRIHVDDDGPGMSKEALASATNPFYRGETSRSRTTGGAGLGLTLCDAIVRSHGGSLTLANRQPTGLRATIHLPLP